MDKIVIDLGKLTQAHVDEVRAHVGRSEYAAPCIIGSLLTPEQREFLDAWHDPRTPPTPVGASYDVNVLHGQGVIEIIGTAAPVNDAIILQNAFDTGEDYTFDAAVGEFFERQTGTK